MIDTRRLFPCTLVAACLFATALFAQEKERSDDIRVGYGAICTDVQNHEPIGADTIFSAAVGSLYCFTRVEGAVDTTRVTHVWYYGEKKMTEITLAVRSPRWRTYSNKKILPVWTGKWNVVVLSEAGDPLAQLSFFVRAAKPE